MIIRPSNTPRAKKISGYLWLLAGLLMIAPSMLSDQSNSSLVAIGLTFITFGLVFLRSSKRA